MNIEVKRIYVEKKPEFNIEAQELLFDLKENLGIPGLEAIRVVSRYDIEGITNEEYSLARYTIFAEPPIDIVYDEEIIIERKDSVFAVEYLPGQYDQRADSAAQCIQILTHRERPAVASANLIILQGELSNSELEKVKAYYINPVDSREASLEKPSTLKMETEIPKDVESFDGFIDYTETGLEEFMNRMGLAMSFEDLKFCQGYFKDTEKRNPTITEIKVIDTYWSDHCRHTTFLTEITDVEIAEAKLTKPIQTVYKDYLASREFVYGETKKDINLMDIALMGMRELRKAGKLTDLDVSDEINACSIVVPVDVDGKEEEWLIMFKNETHNHPTEIEPFGGAATCLGGAIRDPLSGRSYVYQAMRVTGSGDPRVKIEETLPGKLPQRKITTAAAAGYSSYGNQIGLATGHVAEVYDQDFIAKRMEIGAVIAAAPKENVVRETPVEGDVIILLGGKTGRDGCGGATGSSKEHTEESISTCGAEVQKGNPPTERKIQRLFRDPEVSKLIKKCNDFGAGGVCVSIGELTDGLEINLDAVPKKYEGLDGTELAISESQERMAIVVDKKDVEKLQRHAEQENVEASIVATVTSDQRLKMSWRGKEIVDISRDFLNTNGVQQSTKVKVVAPLEEDNFFNLISPKVENQTDIKAAWLANLEDLNVCSQKGLVERFDSSIGAGTVLMPFGGKHQATPAETMVAKVPVLDGDTNTGTVMSFGYNPRLAKWSPFHGALYAVIEAVAKIVATGGDYAKIRLTLQEYFEKLGQDSSKWGKPFSALLGAYLAQKELGIPAIGGKDSMSGTFKDLNVPPTLVAFAVDVIKVDKVISPEFKDIDSQVVVIPLKRDDNELPSFDQLKSNFAKISELINKGKVLAAHTVRFGGIAEAISKMTFGNRIGMVFTREFETVELFRPDYGSIILEISAQENLKQILGSVEYVLLGHTQAEAILKVNGISITVDEAQSAWEKPLERIFPTKKEVPSYKAPIIAFEGQKVVRQGVSIAKPRILIPVFPGTNCEYDSAKAFQKAGGVVDTVIFKNLNPSHIEESLEALVKAINSAQIVMLPGGFSAGDEPDGSGKFIATVFRNSKIKEAVMKLLNERDGLMLGICNGFQALIKLGLVPFGEIRELTEESPTLTHNTINRHISCMVQTKVVSTLSPWYNNVKLGDIHSIPASHGEGRFVASDEVVNTLIARGQVATQYVDFAGNPTYDIAFNPNGSVAAIESITSADGRILGKMGHSERLGKHVAKNIIGEKDQKIFEAGVRYFR